MSAVACDPGRRPRRHPRDHPGHRGRRPAARRAPGEPAPRAAEPARGGGRVPAAAATTSAARTRSWPTRIGRRRPQISNTLRLLQAPAPGPAPGRCRRAVGRPRPRAARPRRRRGMERLAQRIVAEGLSVRATEEIVRSAGDAEPAAVEPRRAAGAQRGARRPRRAALGSVRDPGEGRPRASARARSPSSSRRCRT